MVVTCVKKRQQRAHSVERVLWCSCHFGPRPTHVRTTSHWAAAANSWLLHGNWNTASFHLFYAINNTHTKISSINPGQMLTYKTMQKFSYDFPEIILRSSQVLFNSRTTNKISKLVLQCFCKSCLLIFSKVFVTDLSLSWPTLN